MQFKLSICVQFKDFSVLEEFWSRGFCDRMKYEDGIKLLTSENVTK